MDFASIAVVDPRGWILMQERDEHPVIDPEKWGLPGGGIEPGEDARTAAHRELAEETSLVMTSEPTLVGDFPVHCELHGEDRCWLFAIRMEVTDGEVECHEGRQMVFVAPDRARRLDLTSSAADLLPGFLDSDLYRELSA